MLLFSGKVTSDSVTTWTAAHQVSLSFTTSRSLLRFMSIELVVPSHHLIFCCPLSPLVESTMACLKFTQKIRGKNKVWWVLFLWFSSLVHLLSHTFRGCMLDYILMETLKGFRCGSWSLHPLREIRQNSKHQDRKELVINLRSPRRCIFHVEEIR